jgi:hypothetical protein
MVLQQFDCPHGHGWPDFEGAAVPVTNVLSSENNPLDSHNSQLQTDFFLPFPLFNNGGGSISSQLF